MKTLSKPLFFIFLLLTALSSHLARAEQAQDFGQYSVHYITVNSNFIDADIAEQYGIVRGKRRAFVNISILKNTSDGRTTPVTANLSGTKKNLLQQIENIDFVQVQEGEAIYYLGQFDFSNAEKLSFDIDVQPEASGATYSLKWNNTLYNN